MHASVEPEPFGLVLVEAMAAGKPVVATAQGGPLEIVEEGITGFLVPPGDAEALAGALGKLLADEGLGRRMGEAGRQRAWERFSVERMVRELEEVYEGLF